MSNTSEATQRIMYDLASSDEKGYKEYGVTIDRVDYNHADWLKEAYEECLDMSKYLRRALDTTEESVSVRKVSDILLEINAVIQASMGKGTDAQEKARNKQPHLFSCKNLAHHYLPDKLFSVQNF